MEAQHIQKAAHVNTIRVETPPVPARVAISVPTPNDMAHNNVVKRKSRSAKILSGIASSVAGLGSRTLGKAARIVGSAFSDVTFFLSASRTVPEGREHNYTFSGTGASKGREYLSNLEEKPQIESHTPSFLTRLGSLLTRG